MLIFPRYVGKWASKPPVNHNLSFTPLRESPQAQGLVSWWPINLRPKNVSGAGTGIYESISFLNDPVMGIMWRTLGGSITLSGQLDLFAGNPLTVTFWMRTTQVDPFVTVIGFFSTTAPFGGFGVGFNNSGLGKLLYWGGDGAGSNKIGNTNVNDGVLHFHAIVVQGTTINFYFDAVADGTDTAQVPTSYTGTRRLLANDTGSFPFKGDIADIRIYNRALSPATIRSMYDPKTRWDLYKDIEYHTIPGTFATSSSPFFQIDWPNPGLGRRNNTGYIHTTTSLIPPPEAITNAQRNWPNPLIGKRNHVGHIDYDTFIDSNEKPDGSSTFPLIEARKKGPDWNQRRPLYYQDTKPFKQDAWPNPALEFKPAITHIHNRKPDESPTPEPFKIPLFPNPLKKERVRPGHTDNFSLEETFTHPVGSSVQDLSVLNVKPLPHTWINPRPVYYTEPEVIVFRQTDWPNPQRKRRLNGVVNTHFLDTGTTQVPFNQNNWPLPLRKRIHPHWEDNYVLDDNVPFIYQVSFVPLSKSKFVPTWIRSLVLSDTDALPNIPYSYPNPIILKQHTQSWIENLLQRTLDPGEGEKPFNQNDYPNPLIGIKLLHVGWIDGRKHYFSEPPLQIAQYDWPVFRAPRINPVGFIHSQKQNEEPPKFVSVLEIPVLKKVLGISWIDTALINLSAPPTIQPFSQKDWPNPRFKIPYYNNFNIFRPTSLVPPNIVGRRICIDAGITIFELEAAIEEFDLNARMEEFNLEAGGEDCE